MVVLKPEKINLSELFLMFWIGKNFCPDYPLFWKMSYEFSSGCFLQAGCRQVEKARQSGSSEA
jgi:hypothetical protein